MITLEALRQAGREAMHDLVRQGKAPGKARSRERAPEKKALLIQSVLDAYERTPPKFETVGGVRRATFPWACLKEDLTP